MMARIALEVETSLPYEAILEERRSWIERKTDELISYDACYTAEALGCKAIVAYTQSGSTAERVSKYRSRVPVIAIAPDDIVCGGLLLRWGVFPVSVAKAPSSVDKLFSKAVETATSLGVAKSGNLIVITAGLPAGTAGVTNLLKVERVE
jgi:pyruvate kinase